MQTFTVEQKKTMLKLLHAELLKQTELIYKYGHNHKENIDLLKHLEQTIQVLDPGFTAKSYLNSLAY